MKEFSATDDVSLYLRSNMDAKNRQVFEDFVKNTTQQLLEENPKKTFPQLPQTEDALLPYPLILYLFIYLIIIIYNFNTNGKSFDNLKYIWECPRYTKQPIVLSCPVTARDGAFPSLKLWQW